MFGTLRDEVYDPLEVVLDRVFGATGACFEMLELKSGRNVDASLVGKFAR